MAILYQNTTLLSIPSFRGLTPHTTLQIISFEELLMSQVVQQEALTRLLIKKGIFTKDEFLEAIKLVNQEMKRKPK
jgi:hypothetical protein